AARAATDDRSRRRPFARTDPRLAIAIDTHGVVRTRVVGLAVDVHAPVGATGHRGRRVDGGGVAGLGRQAGDAGGAAGGRGAAPVGAADEGVAAVGVRRAHGAAVRSDAVRAAARIGDRVADGAVRALCGGLAVFLRGDAAIAVLGALAELPVRTD